MWAAFEAWLIAEASWLGPLGGLAAFGALVWGIVKWPFSRPKPTKLDPDTINQLKPPHAKDGPSLTIPEFIRLRRELKADLEQELTEASNEEKSQLFARIAELERQIADPEPALAEAKARIADLEARLAREANHIGGDRILEARAALEKGDYSIADDIFAEIEARNELAVQEAARAAFGRGEIAEAEVRWADAARHYVRAADLHPTYDALYKATHFSQLAGWYFEAAAHGRTLVDLARKEGEPENLSKALDRYATVFWRQGKNDQAEPLFREALEIDRSTIGERHPDYSTQLNNLASVVEAPGRYKEAEKLYKQALEIDRATIGEGHPAYATRLNNLAVVVKAQGRYEEAEKLYVQALEIDCATIGEGHPDHATRLNNLANLVRAQGRYQEAETLYRQALEIGRATIGEGHPDHAIRLNNLADLLATTGRPDEARRMWQQALTIRENTLPPDHPYIASVKAHLAALDHPPTD